VQGLHHSKVRLNIRGAGVGEGNPGARLQRSVCSVYDIVVSGNQNAWYGGGQPDVGVQVGPEVDSDAEFLAQCVAYSTFNNPIIEGVREGIKVSSGLGNVFLGGTSEDIRETAISLSSYSRRNRVFGLDCEANDLLDVYCLGWENEFIGMDSERVIVFDGTAHRNKVNGGNHTRINFGASTYNNYVGDGAIVGVEINDAAPGKNRYGDVQIAGLWGKGPQSDGTLTPTGSPFVWTNNQARDAVIGVAGGTVTGISLLPNSTTAYASGQTGGAFSVPVGASIAITYSDAPTIGIYRG
jgi:hypothetical protein